MIADSTPSSQHTPDDPDQPQLSDAGLLTAFLADRSAPCRRCGFDLRGLKEPRCPECGSEVRLGLEGLPGHGAQFLVGVVALAMALGGCVVVVLAGIVQSTIFNTGGNRRLMVDFDPAHMLAAMFLFPIFALALLGWLLYARRIDRLPGPARTAAVGACAAAFIALGLLFGMLG